MAYRKLGRTSSQRKAVLRDLTTDLIINEAIVTTEARAKEIRKTVEKMITLGKRGDLHARRQAAAFVRNEIASEKIMIRVNNFNVAISQDISSSNFSWTLDIKFNCFFVFDVRFYSKSLNIKDNLHHVFTDAWYGIKLVEHSINFN